MSTKPGQGQSMQSHDHYHGTTCETGSAEVSAEGTSRRGFLKSGLSLGAAGLVAVATGSGLIAATAAPAAAVGHQYGWRWCNKCYGLFYSGFGTSGLCAAGGSHAITPGTYNYSVAYDLDHNHQVQEGWAYCPRCECLTWAAGNGWCPGSGHHILQGNSLNYALAYGYPDTLGWQAGWRWCHKCQNLAFAGNGPGICAYSGRHDHSGSFAYGVGYAR